MLFTNKKRKQRFERTIKAAFLAYFERISPQYILQLQITDILVEPKKGKIETTVTLCKPALLVGIEGKTLDGLREFVQHRLERPFTITIKESRLWQ